MLMAVRERGRRVSKREDAGPVTVAKMQRALRKHAVAVNAPTEATPATVIKLREPPIGKLITENKLGADEVQAARHIELAFNTLASRLMVRGMSLEKIDQIGQPSDRRKIVTARIVGQYQDFANHWSGRWKLYGDPTLQILIAAIIDQRSLSAIAADMGFAKRKIEKAVIFGLRDFAARTSMVSTALAKVWMHEAARVFVNGPLVDAMRRARLEK